MHLIKTKTHYERWNLIQVVTVTAAKLFTPQSHKLFSSYFSNYSPHHKCVRNCRS